MPRVLTAGLVVALLAPVPTPVRGVSPPESVMQLAGGTAPTREGSVRSSLVTIDTGALAGTGSATFELPDGIVVSASGGAVPAAAGSGFTWRGVTDGGSVSLAVLGDAAAGMVTTSEARYLVRPTADGTAVYELGPDSGVTDGEPLMPPPLAGSPAPRSTTRSSDPVVVDVLVVHTPAARAGAGGEAAVAALAQAAIDEANDAFAASGIRHRLRLVGAAPVAYTESGSNSIDLNRLTADGDGAADEVHDLRDDLGADIVVMFLGTGTFAGTAWQMTPTRFAAPELMAELAFAVVVVDFAVGDWVVVHEIGHIMGADHDPDNGLAPGGDGVFPYSLGFRMPGEFRTIMAYPCRFGCVQVGQFSNPTVPLAGHPTGTTAADNAATVNATAPTVAAFRAAQVLPPSLGPLDPRLGMVDPAQGLWYLGSPAGPQAPFFFGNPGDTPFIGDWDCDGVATPGMYRPSDGYVYLRNSNRAGVADISFFFGNPGDAPIAGDFDGDGCDTVSIYRPGEGKFHIINRLGSGDAGLGAADAAYSFGDPGDKPFVGDFDADGIDTVGLHREASGLVYLNNEHRAGVADAEFIFGNPGDRLVAHDWNGDGRDSVGVYRPFARRFFLRFTNIAGGADADYVFGAETWLPVAGELGGS